MDWGKLVGSLLEIGAPLVGKIAEAAMSSNSMTPEQVAALDAQLADMVTQLRRDMALRIKLQEERNAKVDAAIAEKFGKVDE